MIRCMLVGAAGLLVTKYIVFGLDRWNSTFHPTRVEDPNTPFKKGLLDLIPTQGVQKL